MLVRGARTGFTDILHDRFTLGQSYDKPGASEAE